MADADPALVVAWLRGRSLARALPPPVPYSDGWRVDTRSAVEHARYVFPKASTTIAALAQEIETPRTFLKACVTDTALAALLDPRWVLRAPGWMMIGPPAAGGIIVPAPYSLTLNATGAGFTALIVDGNGAIAASGHAAEVEGAFVFDRIVCEPAHRRRGLGRALMTTLSSARRCDRSIPVLVATADGRALYETLGWTVHAPYASAERA